MATIGGVVPKVVQKRIMHYHSIFDHLSYFLFITTADKPAKGKSSESPLDPDKGKVHEIGGLANLARDGHALLISTTYHIERVTTFTLHSSLYRNTIVC